MILSLTDPGMKTLIDGTNAIKDHGLVGLILERLQSALFCMVSFLDIAPDYLVRCVSKREQKNKVPIIQLLDILMAHLSHF